MIYTPREAHFRIFVARGSFFARQKVAKKSFSCGECKGAKNRRSHTHNLKVIEVPQRTMMVFGGFCLSGQVH